MMRARNMQGRLLAPQQYGDFAEWQPYVCEDKLRASFFAARATYTQQAQSPFQPPSAGDVPTPWSLMASPGKRISNPMEDSTTSEGSETNDTSSAYARWSSSYTSSGPEEIDSYQYDPLTGPDGKEMKTFMIKNIPCRCSQEEILDAVEEVGFGQLYNFFYLPMTQGQTHNIGYVFIGFYDEHVAVQFAQAMTGYRFKRRNSTKSCEVVPARIQGFQSNFDHFQKRTGMRKRNYPIWRTSL